MNENKKQNKKTMLAAVLFLSLIATSAFIWTLAKYVTSNTASDDAVAAKFGFNIPNAIDLFSESYGDDVKTDTGGKKIIAPGTSGEFPFSVIGTSEVACAVSAKITAAYSEEWNGYEPLQFSIDGSTWITFAQFKTNLEAALAKAKLAPNENYENEATIHWKWPFHVSAENDVKDTEIGRAANGESAPEVTVTIEVTATQLDEDV